MPPLKTPCRTGQDSVYAIIPVLSIVFFKKLVNFVADAPDGLNEPGIAGGLAHFFPQAADMNHNGIIAVQVFLPPHALKEPLGGDDLAPVLTEHPENVKLNGGEAQLPVVEGTLVGARLMTSR